MLGFFGQDTIFKKNVSNQNAALGSGAVSYVKAQTNLPTGEKGSYT